MKKKMAAFWIAFGITAGTTALELSPLPSFVKQVVKASVTSGIKAVQTPTEPAKEESK